MSQYYLALTIGPIHKTMQMARKTREFWAASMLFSLLSKELCSELLKAGIQEDDFLVPDKTLFKKQVRNIGLYMDRIICRVSSTNFLAILENEIIYPALKKLAGSLNSVQGVNVTAEELKNYFKIYAICKTCLTDNPLGEISTTLNTLEVFNVQNSYDTLSKKVWFFLENVNTEYDDQQGILKSSFLEKYFDVPDYNGKIRLPSIGEISTYQLRAIAPIEKKPSYKEIFDEINKNGKTQKKDLFGLLRTSFETNLKTYHKYYCIIQADGDKLGATLMKSDRSAVSNISADLISWGEIALKELLRYGALPIYIGGDDLLSFAPVNNGNETILDLAYELNSQYNQMSHLTGITTLSIGVKISYYKSPMYEAYIDTFDLLMKAKEFSNSCCINIDKHSGQPHQFRFSFNEEYKQFVKPISDTMVSEEKEKSFLTSVIYSILNNEELIFTVCNNKNRLWAFFQNNFDEARDKRDNSHLNSLKYKYLYNIMEYIHYLFVLFGDKKDKESGLYLATLQLYSTLKTLRFIKGLDDDKE